MTSKIREANVVASGRDGLRVQESPQRLGEGLVRVEPGADGWVARLGNHLPLRALWSARELLGRHGMLPCRLQQVGKALRVVLQAEVATGREHGAGESQDGRELDVAFWTLALLAVCRRLFANSGPVCVDGRRLRLRELREVPSRRNLVQVGPERLERPLHVHLVEDAVPPVARPARAERVTERVDARQQQHGLDAFGDQEGLQRLAQALAVGGLKAL
mmetsp:Transcript_14370/g.44635  ORF Transcript_14370/g.44635 Transcript_14370/m.44635 type:complete len:218 (-) Transcript_14370:345-998(-)